MRDADDYERVSGRFTEITMGYFARGHVDRRSFLNAVLEEDPGVVVEPHHWGWWGRWKIHGCMNDSRATPYKPAEMDIHHLHWRNYAGGFRVARLGTRGSFPVTHLPVEADGGTSQLWDFEGKEPDADLR